MMSFLGMGSFKITFDSGNKRAIGVTAFVLPCSQSWSGRIPDYCFQVFLCFCTTAISPGTILLASFKSTTHVFFLIVPFQCYIFRKGWNFPRTRDLFDTRIVCAEGRGLVFCDWSILSMRFMWWFARQPCWLKRTTKIISIKIEFYSQRMLVTSHKCGWPSPK